MRLNLGTPFNIYINIAIIFLLLFTILSIFILFSHSIDALGILTIPNHATPIPYGIETNALVLAPELTLSYNNTGGNRARKNASTINNRDTAWEGGALYVTIDKIRNANIYDTLSCTPTDATITTTYNIASRTLTISANASVTVANLQATLRTVKLKVRGHHSEPRIVRFWVASEGFCLSRADRPRLYAVTHATMSDTATFTWDVANADAIASPIRFGMKPYLATVTSDEDTKAVKKVLTATGSNDAQQWLNGRRNPSNSAEWIWGDGAPEAGKRFWTGNAANHGTPGSIFTADGLNYANWYTSEPNNISETRMVVYGDTVVPGGAAAGFWNDSTNTAIERYIVAYGGRDDDTNVVVVNVISQNSLRLFQSPL